MKSKIKTILKSLLSSNNKRAEISQDQEKVATAVLFLELAYADFEIMDEEVDKIKSSLMEFFELAENEYLDLLETAKIKRGERNDIWLFTQHIKETFSREQKLKILDMLWQLVYADGNMDKYEEVLMRTITNLLGLSHGEMIASKHKAKE